MQFVACILDIDNLKFTNKFRIRKNSFVKVLTLKKLFSKIKDLVKFTIITLTTKSFIQLKY